ncbi:hypothetical protein [Streptantibioticus silvisoli]|uniref:Uncharacterized protein n=1 Tax=Streptantibioticus silvisoli TaxID=2705255 RepID=A0ABT6W4P2_9ACTN|nr:hypothetical protein [Streptantibioticus silvisoli]MDI5965723.1 hypothetical protein [Streptantibioticus silvisoli]
MPTVPVRKQTAGSDSYGHTWGRDGDVVQVDYDEAMELVAIPDGGFTVDDQGDSSADKQPSGGGEAPSAIVEPALDAEMSEVDPKDDDATDSTAKKTPGRRRTTS